MRHIKTAALALAICLAMTICAPALAAVVPTFTDVPATHKHYAAIEYCVKNEFVNGKGNRIFDPSGSLTRGHFAMIWARTLHLRKHNFSDATKTRDEQDNAIVLLQGWGIIDGVSGTQYDINRPITREQVAKITHHTYYEIDEVTSDDGHKVYTDYADISDWAVESVGVMADKGLFDNIVAGSEFKPQQNMNRGEVCQLLYNLIAHGETPVNEYDIKIGTFEGGKVTSNKAQAAAGETVTLTITPNRGKMLLADSLKANGTVLHPNGSTVTFRMPDSDVTVVAKFTDSTIEPLYRVAIGAMSGGSVTPDKTEAAKGETVTLTVNPENGKKLKAGSLKVPPPPPPGTSFSMPEENVTVTAEFVTAYEITIVSVDNGSIRPNINPAAEGEEVLITAYPEAGYRIKGNSFGVYNYNESFDISVEYGKTFTMPAYGVTVEAEFAPII